MSGARVARELDVHENMLRNWVKEFAVDPQHAFSGEGQMNPEQSEIKLLRREVIKLKAERNIQKTRGILCEGLDISSPSSRSIEDLSGGMVGRGALCLAGGLNAWLTTMSRAALPPTKALLFPMVE